VAHHQQGAGPVVEEVLDSAQRVEVDVVGGLIEQQDVRSLGQDEQQLQSPALATRERADRCPLGVAVEPEPLQQRGVMPVRVAGRAGHRVPHPPGRIERSPDLVMEADADGRPGLDPTFRRWEPLRDQIEERGLAGPVRADDPQPLTRVEQQVDMAEQPRPVRRRRPEPMPHAVQLHHLVAQPRGVAVQRQLAGPERRIGSVIHQVGGRHHASLGLARPGRRSSPQPRQLTPDEVAADRGGSSVPFDPFRPRREVRRVAAFVDMGPAPVELQDPSGDPIEHVAIVGDEDETTAMSGDAILQPHDRVEIELVGRLVEDEQHRIVVGSASGADLHQRPRQRHPLGLTARQRGHLAVDERRHAESVDDRLDLPAFAPGRAANRSCGQCRFLIERDDPRAATPPDHAGFGRDRPSQRPQQGGLAAAIQPDHREPIAAGQGDRDVGEQRTAGPGGGKAGGVEQDHAGGCRPIAEPAINREPRVADRAL